MTWSLSQALLVLFFCPSCAVSLPRAAAAGEALLASHLHHCNSLRRVIPAPDCKAEPLCVGSLPSLHQACSGTRGADSHVDMLPEAPFPVVSLFVKSEEIEMWSWQCHLHSVSILLTAGVAVYKVEQEDTFRGTSLAVQWLRLRAPTAGGPSSIPAQGTRPHMLQLKIPCTAARTWHNPNKYKWFSF